MVKYVILVNWTDQGAHDYANTLQDAQAVAEAFDGAGGKLVDAYWTMGQYDIVVIAQFPDELAAASAALKINGQGRMRTEILRAFEQDQVASLLG